MCVWGAGQIRDVREVLSRKTPTFGDGYVQPGKALGGGFKYFCMFTPIWGKRFPIWRSHIFIFSQNSGVLKPTVFHLAKTMGEITPTLKVGHAVAFRSKPTWCRRTSWSITCRAFPRWPGIGGTTHCKVTIGSNGTKRYIYTYIWLIFMVNVGRILWVTVWWIEEHVEICWWIFAEFAVFLDCFLFGFRYSPEN